MADHAVRPLDGDFGAEVTGIDLSREVGPQALAGLRRLFHERQLMVRFMHRISTKDMAA